MFVVAATGHRPDKLGGYRNWDAIRGNLIEFAELYLSERQPDQGICGMAQGWDMCFAQALTNLRIPWIAAVPFVGQESRWPEKQQREYNDLLARAAQVVVVCDGRYANYKFLTRNRWMVDRASEICALWNGDKEGGTASCLNYARRKKVPIRNLWDRWVE